METISIKQRSIITNQLTNDKMVDVMKYAAAVMVICIHCEQLFPQEYLNFFIKNIICRIAVPFFFISSAYFVRKGSDANAEYVKSYLHKLLKSYWMWSLVFIPIGLDWIHQNLSLAEYLLLFALLYGLIHIGTYYHLWYIPAMMLSIYLADKLLKRISYKILFTAATALFMFGSLESYYGLLPNGWLKDFFDLLMMAIFTTRSGLLYGMVFTLMGFYIYDKRSSLTRNMKYIPILTIASLILLIIEGTFLFQIDRLDMNFLLMLLPFSFCLFLWVLAFPYIPKCDTRKLRKLSKYYYFVHPVCIVIIEEIGKGLGIDIISSGVISLLFIILLTHSLSSFMIKIRWPLKNLHLFMAAFLGILFTVVLSGIFFQFKRNEIVVKFELIPCLWFYSSFVIYYRLSKNRISQKVRLHK